MVTISEILPPSVYTWSALKLPDHPLTEEEWLSVYEMLHYGAVRELFDKEHTDLLERIKATDDDSFLFLIQQLNTLRERRSNELVFACELDEAGTKNIIAFPARLLEENDE